MAVAFLSPAKTLLQKHNAITKIPLCSIRASSSGGGDRERDTVGISPSSLSFGKRGFALSICSVLLAGKVAGAQAAVLEDEDDLELLEKVKQDRKKRLEKQTVINSAKKETGYLQDLVYKLSQVGQALDSNDLSTASSVLSDSDWLKNVNSAFSKLSSSPEEKAEVDAFNSSVSELISSVAKKDMESSKLAFVSSATAFEKWTALTGLVAKLKGL